MKKLMKQIYDPEEFRKSGHEIIDVLANYLHDAQEQKIPVMDWKKPDEQLNIWENIDDENLTITQLFEKVISNSIHIHHPRYMGHQVCPPAPISAIAEFVGALLNNGMAIYEMGPAATAIEKLSVNIMCKKVGYNSHSDGFITSGGTLANITGLLAARQWYLSKNNQVPISKLGIMVSSEAHYSVERAMHIMGFSESGIIKVPVTSEFRIDADKLEQEYKNAEDNGINIIGVAGSAPSTSTGIYDDLVSLADFCKEKKLWFHVDAAHGGGAVFSKKYSSLLRGMEFADSIVIDAHKMMMTPALTTFLLFKNRQDSYNTFSQKAEYLLEKAKDDKWFDIAQRTMECTKIMQGLRFWIILKHHGVQAIDAYVTSLYDLAKEMADEILKRNSFELALYPESNIVCFRYVDDSHDNDEINNLTDVIRKNILEKGDYYIVQTNINGQKYLRVTLMNPLTDICMIIKLLDDIEKHYSKL